MLGMATLRLDLEVQQGATFQYVFGLTGGPAAGSIEGFTARMQIRPFKTSDDILASWTSPGQITVDNVNKQLVIKVTDEATTLLDFGQAVYDLELEGNGDVWRVAEGVARLSREVTR